MLRQRQWLGKHWALVVNALVVIALATGVMTYASINPNYPVGRGPNIVFVLTDDLSTDLVKYMPNVQALMRRGMTFSNYTVTDSLCCPSRASIFTGEFPHNTGVRTNIAPDGGWEGFVRHGDQARSFAIALQHAGYRTGFLGKYLNGYQPARSPSNPPGWNYWVGVGESAYMEYNYWLSLNGVLQHYGKRPSDYLTNVLGRLSNEFLDGSADSSQPFLLEVASFTPHHPFVPASPDLNKFPNLRAPRGPAWNRLPKNPPRWLAVHPPMTSEQISTVDDIYRQRVLDVLSLDRLVGRLENKLREQHKLDDTVFVFSSDNGFHTGQYTLTSGKMTAFDTDVRVPLVVAGPDIPAGSTNALPVENIDLAPTFERLAGAPIPPTVDGHSLVPVLHGQRPLQWRSFSGIEHSYPGEHPNDPDEQSLSAGILPSYTAIRSPTFTYVQYVNGQHEYYNLVKDPYELDNLYPTLPAATKADLAREVEAIGTCAGYESCWQAAQPAADPGR